MRVPFSDDDTRESFGSPGHETVTSAPVEARTSDAWLRKLIDIIPVQAWCALPDGKNEFSNRRWQEYTGIASEEAHGWGWQAAVHPDDLPVVMQRWAEVVASREAGEFELRLRRHDGVFRWFLCRTEPFPSESGEIAKWCGTSTDIDGLKQSEARLRSDAHELRLTVDAIPQTIGVLDPSGAVLYANQMTLDYTGSTAEDMVAPGFRERIFHPEDLQRLREDRKTALADGVMFEIEQRARRGDGQYRWFLVRYNPLRDDQGHVVRWYVTGTDIDELKRAEAKLRQDEQELRRITDVIPQTIIVLNPDGNAIYANRVALEYGGLSLDEVRAEDFRARVFHPEDVQRLHAERSRALSGTVPFENEQRARGKDGKYRWFLMRYNPLLDERGQVIRWYATGTDIDDRKRAEVQMRNEAVALREDIDRSSMFEEIIGSSAALRRVLAEVSRVAPTDSTVLIQGETGTGKELIARAVHSGSRRSSRAFIRVNCAAIPPSLIASELFGHEKGAFTGAMQRRLGRFELADGGTIFLDEIGELPLEAQSSLLRVLQEREVERVGGSQPVPVDIRVITATNRDLSTAAADGTFRRDLFYRLNVFPIHLPALRDRADDIPLLVEHMVHRYAQTIGKKIRHISKETVDLFVSYDWPGNIRELQNVIEREVILCDAESFYVDPGRLVRVAKPKALVPSTPFVADLVAHERAMIEDALTVSQGRISGSDGAAAKLGMPRQTLESKIKKLGIKRHRFKTS